MSKTRKMIKKWLALMGVIPTNRNARKTLHRLRRYEPVIKAEAERINNLVLRYELPDDSKED